MKRNALVIQSAYRGWVVRRDHTKMRAGIVKMRRQKSQLIEIKEEMKQGAETKKKAREVHQVARHHGARTRTSGPWLGVARLF